MVESVGALAGDEVLIVVCNELLDDGKYEDLVQLAVRSEMQAPVSVVSRTGEWPEYLAAMRGGAFDYLAYPTISRGPSTDHPKCAAESAPRVEKNGKPTSASTQ